MRCTSVRCAVQAIAEAVGQLPLHVYMTNPDGSKSRAVTHPVYGILHDAVNDYTSACDFKEQIIRDALLHGNGYAFINRVGGNVIELNRLRPEQTIVEEDPITGDPIYRAQLDLAGKFRVLGFKDVFHIRAPAIGSYTALRGDSIVMSCRDAIGLALALEAHASRLFANGGRPSGILSFPAKLSADVAARIKASWRAATGGQNSGQTAVLEEGGDFKPLSFNSVNSQFLELRAFAIDEIARAFRVPPVLLHSLARATWANSEELGRQFVTLCLLPWLTKFESEVRLKLFDAEDDTFRAEFFTDDFLRADLQARTTAYANLINSRILNPNEVRAMENRPPYAGGDAFINPNTTAGALAANAAPDPAASATGSENL